MLRSSSRSLVLLLLIAAQLLPMRCLLAQGIIGPKDKEAGATPVMSADEREYLAAKARAFETIKTLRRTNRKEAIRLAHVVFQNDQKAFGVNHEYAVTTLQLMGDLYWESGDLPTAAKCREAIREIRENLYGKEDWRRNRARWFAEQWKHLASPGDFSLAHANAKAEAFLAEAEKAYLARQYDTAIAAAQKAAKVVVEVYGEGNVPLYADALGWIALSLVDQGKYSEAQALYKQMDPIYRGWYGEVSPKYARLLISRGLAATESSERERYYREAIEVNDKIEGDDDTELAFALSSLAGHYHQVGRYAQAEELILRAISIEEALRGGDGQMLKNMQIEAARIYRLQSKFTECEALLKSLLAFYPADPKRSVDGRVIVHDELSQLYMAQKKYDLAETEARQAIDLERKTFGETRLAGAWFLSSLGFAQFRSNQHDAAAQSFEQSLALASKLAGPKSSYAIAGADSLSVVLRTQAQTLNAAGDRAAARAKLQQAADKTLSVLGEQHAAAVMLGMALAVQDQIEQLPEELAKNALEAERISQQGYDSWNAGDAAKAEELFRQAIKLRETLGDKQHPFVTAQGNYWLADVLQKQEKWAESEQPLMVALPAYEEVFKGSNPTIDYANVPYLLGKALEKRGARPEAIEQFRLARELYGRIYGPESNSVLELMYRIGSLYLDQFDYERSMAVFREYADVIARVYGKTSRRFAVALDWMGSVEFQCGSSARARVLFVQAADVRKALGEEQSEEYRKLIASIAGCDERSGNLDAAVASYETIIAQLRTLEDRDLLRHYLLALSPIEAQRGRYERAEQLAQEGLDIATELYGEQHARTQSASNVLTNIWIARIPELQSAEKFQEAVALRERVLAEHIKSYGQESPQLRDIEADLALDKQVAQLKPEQQQTFAKAEARMQEAKKLVDSDQGSAAAEAAMAAAALYRTLLGDNSPKLADALFAAATCQPSSAQLDDLYREVLKIRQAAFGQQALPTAHVHLRFGEKLAGQDRYQESLEQLKVASEIYRAHQSGSDVGAAMASLGAAYVATGDFAAAQIALDEAEPLLAPWQDHANGFAVWNTLLNARGRLVGYLGDFEEWRRLKRLVLQRKLQRFGEESLGGAIAKIDMANVCLDTFSFEEAAPLLESALSTLRKLGHESTIEVAWCLRGMGAVQQQKGAYDLAASNLEQARQIVVEKRGPESREYLAVLAKLSSLHERTGKFAEAESILREMLELEKKVGGTTSRGYGITLTHLVESLVMQEKFADAASLAEESVHNIQRVVSASADFQTERQQAATMRGMRIATAGYLVASAQQHDLVSKGYDHVLQLKGSIFARQRRLRELRDDLAAAKLLEQWGRVTGALATLSLKVPYPDERVAWSQRIALLTADKDLLERQLLALSSDKSTPHTSTEKLRTSLPAKSAFVDFFCYERFRVLPDGSQEVGLSAYAFVLRPDKAEIARLDLGDIKGLGEAIDRWRAAVSWQQSEEAEKAFAEDDQPTLEKLFIAAQEVEHETAATIKKRIWEPLQERLAGVELVIVSPDGPLAKFPLAALPGEAENTYLIEDVALTTVAVPSMLPELLARTANKSEQETLLVMGDVAYGGSAGLADVRDAKLADSTRGWLPFSFPDLAADRAEMDDILRFFGDRFADGKSLVLDNEKATEGAFRREASRHRWLHLATHGFYAPDISEKVEANMPAVKVAESALGGSTADAPAIVHEGLMSGLALAGANEKNAPGEDDGVLSAMEVSSMDLSGVEMAVLSACETGLGNSVSGEGVVGLQRAFQVAGARSTVTSLWSVGDLSSRLLIARFYRNVWNGKMSKAAAMREAQRWMIEAAWKDKGDVAIDDDKLTIDAEVLPMRFRRPDAWAPFVLSGDWR